MNSPTTPHGRPALCLNCRRWTPDRTHLGPKDGLPNAGHCALHRCLVGRLHSCPQIALKFKRCDSSAVIAASDRHWAWVQATRARIGPDAPLPPYPG